jgi:hypothetical protein
MKPDRDKILELLAKADTAWYEGHSGDPSGRDDYRRHIEFTAGYIAENYDEEGEHEDLEDRNQS